MIFQMNEFKSPSRSASQPLSIDRGINSHSDDDSLKWTSQGLVYLFIY